MNFMQINNRSHHHFILLTLMLFGLFGIIFAQTFQYSRGWTNGKKRSSLESFLLQDKNSEPEVLGICQMQRLKEIWDNRHLNTDYLPCEMIGKPEIDILEKRNRKYNCNRKSLLDSIPPRPN